MFFSCQLLALSFSKVPATELGVKYDNIFKHVASKPYTESGLYTIGPFAYFVIGRSRVRSLVEVFFRRFITLKL